MSGRGGEFRPVGWRIRRLRGLIPLFAKLEADESLLEFAEIVFAALTLCDSAQGPPKLFFRLFCLPCSHTMRLAFTTVAKLCSTFDFPCLVIHLRNNLFITTLTRHRWQAHKMAQKIPSTELCRGFDQQ